jgi:predicted nucleotidyltransferase
VTASEAQVEAEGRDDVLTSVARVLQDAGAVFAYLHGSRAAGTAKPGSDVDVAAWFGRSVDTWEVAAALPANVDLLVLDTAPLELAGRVAQQGRLLFEVDPAARVRWEATTRKIYLDEQPRLERARRDFVDAQLRG